MLFSSNIFLFVFLPAVLGVYYLCPRRARNPVLLGFSLFFYGWGEPVYLFLMIGVIVLDHLCGLWIAKQRDHGGSGKSPLAVGVGVNLLILGFFKYSALLLGRMVVPLPIGISFYIFQSMSYLVDVYRNQAPVQRNIVNFGTYVALFPQLIAGPIVRYTDIAHQLERRQENFSQFASGVELFLVGLSKKILLANPMGSLWNQLQAQPGATAAWVGLAAYTLQIYFDFSGYSHMAMGLGRMFGFEFLDNFNYPYTCTSITEFWRRWHISLSTWFREYVYIPLGGNRRGLGRQIVNMLVVWLLTGLWHGASWNFVLWGGYYALLLIGEKTFLLRLLSKLPKAVGWVYTMLAVMLGWALFYFEDFGALAAFFARLFTPVPSPGARTVILGALPLMAVGIVAATPLVKTVVCRRRNSAAMEISLLLAGLGALLLCTAALARQNYNPFIYFRF